MNVSITMVNYTITANNLHLIDSYRARKRDFKVNLLYIKSNHPESLVWNKGEFEMKMEWAVHNFCYALHIKRDRTKDCDLNYPQKWYVRIAYIICGMISWIFIR